LVKRDLAADKVGGVYLPDVAQATQPFGTVVSVDEAAGLLIQPGDRIVFGEYAGTSIDIDGEKFLILDGKDVLGILGGEE
jgi:chaperonin GroES